VELPQRLRSIEAACRWNSASETMDNATRNAMHQHGHEGDAYRRIELITGIVRRRRWTAEEKEAIVAESMRPGVNVSELARRYGVNRGLLQTWRRKVINETAVFVPLRIDVPEATVNCKVGAKTPSNVAAKSGSAASAGTLEIESGGVCVRFSGSVDTGALRLVLAHMGRRS